METSQQQHQQLHHVVTTLPPMSHNNIVLSPLPRENNPIKIVVAPHSNYFLDDMTTNTLIPKNNAATVFSGKPIKVVLIPAAHSTTSSAVLQTASSSNASQQG